MRSRPLRQQLTTALTLAAAVPVLVVGAGLARRGAAQRRAAAEAALQQAADALCRAADARLARDRAGVETLAAALAPAGPRRSRTLTARMARFHALHPDFRTVLATDSAGTIVGASPDAGADGAPNTGRSVADRPYFRDPMRGAPGSSPSFVSDAFRGRGFGTAPIVAVSAAVRDSAGRPLGIVEGSLDLEAFARIARGVSAGEGSAFAIVDRGERVVLGGEALGLLPLADAAGHPLIAAARAATPGAAFRVASGADGDRHLAARCATALGWTVVGRVPTARLDRETREAFALTLAWAVLAAGAAAAAGAALARRLATPLQELAGALQEHRPGRPFLPPATGPGTPVEVALVAARLGTMTARVDAVDAELREVVRRREDEIRERVGDLAAAEQRARRGAAQYRLLYERSPRAAWVYDVETLRFLSVNAAAERMYGWTRDEFLGRTVLDVRPPELRDAAAAPAHPSADRDETAHEGVHLTRDGRRLDVSLVSQAVDYEGRPARLVLVEDVGERRRALEQLEAAERRLREVLEALDEGVILYTEQGVPLWNSAAERIFGLTGAQVSRREPRPERWRLLDPSGAPVPPEALAPARARATGARAVDELLQLERPDGSRAWIAGSATPVALGEGGERAVVATVRDVTRAQEAARAVEESEARFRGVLETVSAVVVTLDFDGRVTFANDALLELTGWTRGEAVGSDWFARFLPDDAARRAAMKAVLSPDGAVAHHEHEVVTRGGERRLVAWDNTLLRDAAGALVGTASVGRDVTEQRANERRLAALSERDELTGLLNRRGFEAAVAAAHARPRASARLSAVLAMDLDGFKPINDTFGHAAGDDALRAVGRLLETVLRGVDHAGRLGGDEFAVYLADLQRPEDLHRVVERLGRVLAAHNEEAARAGRPFRLAWSVGAALRDGAEPLAATLARADAALYREKRGRQRVA